MENKKRPAKRSVNWKRVVIVAALALGAVAFAYDSLQVADAVNEQNNKEVTVSYTVQQGDSLWGIAKMFYGESEDVDKVVYMIKQANDIQSDDVMAGKVLMIKLPRKDI